MPLSAPEPAASAGRAGQDAVEVLARRWVGRFDNARQVQATQGPRRIEACGVIQSGRLQVQSERLRGRAMEVPDAPGTSVLLFESQEGANLPVQEISQLLEGGRRRLRTTQTLQGGRLLSRSHIEEHEARDDWQDWSPPRSATPAEGRDG